MHMQPFCSDPHAQLHTCAAAAGSWLTQALCCAQVMIACEPSDSILAALLQTNDDLLEAVKSWEATVSRLVMLQSRSAATPAAAASTRSQGSTSSRIATTAPELSDSSSSSTSDLVPTTAPSGGLFWNHLEAAPPAQPPCSTSQQQQQPQQQQLYPTLHKASPQPRQDGSVAADQQRGSSQMQSSSSYLDDLALLQPQYPHQSAQSSQPSDGKDANWQAFGAATSLPSTLPSGSRNLDPQSGGTSTAEQHKEFHGSVLSYRLASPKHADVSEQQSFFDKDGIGQGQMQGSSWPQVPAEARPSSNSAGTTSRQPSDPFAGEPALGLYAMVDMASLDMIVVLIFIMSCEAAAAFQEKEMESWHQHGNDYNAI